MRNLSTRPYFDVLRDSAVATGRIEAWAENMIGSGRTPNLQAAVFKDGQLAMSVAAGRLPAGGIPSRHSLYCILSCTKLFTALAMLTLRDRGYYEFDDPVAEHWPEFGTRGKERITFRHMLSHQGGIPLGPPGTTWTWWGDRETIGRMMARMDLQWEPGQRSVYHNRTFGFVLDYVVWRWLGKGIGDFLRDEVFNPLGIADFHYGISRDLYETRLVKVVGVRPPAGAVPPARPDVADVQGQQPEFRPRIGGESNMFNSFELLRLPLTWGTACASAEAMADVASFYAFKGLHRTIRLFGEEAFAEASRLQGQDARDGRRMSERTNFGLGVRLDVFPDVAGAGRTIGHGGGLTAYVWADVDRALTAACLVGGISPYDVERHRLEFATSVYEDLVL